MDPTETAELADRFLAALEYLDDIGSKITPDQATASFDDASLQVFWRDWPRISGWAGALWRNLNTDLATTSTQARDADLDEVGGEGG